MQLNLQKIDERIQKLQEIRRIAGDPELVSMLFEFIAGDDETHSPARRPEPEASKIQPVAGPRLNEADVVNQAVKSEGGESGLWSRKRA